MKFYVVLFLIMAYLQIPAIAQDQDKDTLKVKNPGSPISGMEFPKLQMDRDLKRVPEIFQNLDLSTQKQQFVLPTMNLNPITNWKVETGTGFNLYYPLAIHTKGFFKLNGWDSFYGYYGSKTYQVNNKLFMGTAAFSDRKFNGYAPTPGWSNQTNYGSSLFVGYKFSEKFSIHASFTIQHNGDPWNMNH